MVVYADVIRIYLQKCALQISALRGEALHWPQLEGGSNVFNSVITGKTCTDLSHEGGSFVLA